MLTDSTISFTAYSWLMQRYEWERRISSTVGYYQRLPKTKFGVRN